MKTIIIKGKKVLIDNDRITHISNTGDSITLFWRDLEEILSSKKDISLNIKGKRIVKRNNTLSIECLSFTINEAINLFNQYNPYGRILTVPHKEEKRKRERV